MNKNIIPAYDATTLDAETRRFLDESEEYIGIRLRRTAAYALQIGERLLAVHERLAGSGRAGVFEPWLRKIGRSQPTAWRYMQLAKLPDEKKSFIMNTFFDVGIMVLLELFARQTPDEIIAGVVDGSIVPTVPAIQAAKQEYAASEEELAAIVGEYDLEFDTTGMVDTQSDNYIISSSIKFDTSTESTIPLAQEKPQVPDKQTLTRYEQPRRSHTGHNKDWYTPGGTKLTLINYVRDLEPYCIKRKNGLWDTGYRNASMQGNPHTWTQLLKLKQEIDMAVAVEQSRLDDQQNTGKNKMTDRTLAPVFDYTQLDEGTRTFLLGKEAEMEVILRRTAKELGMILLEVKARLPHGYYMPWLASKGISQQTAHRWMQIAQGKEIKSPEMSDFQQIGERAQSLHDHARQVVMEYLDTLDEDAKQWHSRGENEYIWLLSIKRATGWAEPEIEYVRKLRWLKREDIPHHAILKAYAIINTPAMKRPSFQEKMYFSPIGLYFHPTDELTEEEFMEVIGYLARLSG